MKRLLLPVYLVLHRHFRFSRVETNGFVLLLVVLALLLLLPTLLLPVLPHYNPAADQQQLNQLAAELAARRVPRKTYAKRYTRFPRRPRFGPVPQVALAPFNPNALAAPDWEARGVPHFVAVRLVRYGQTIGGFKAKSQVQKAYGLEPAVYSRLAPYILLPDQLPPRARPTWPDRRTADAEPAGAVAGARFRRKPAHLQPFDINTADTTQLQQIRGIGHKTAVRVAAYRERLGGFISASQLTEIFALPPDMVDSLRKYTFVQPGFVPAPLAVNTATLTELKAHPYVGPRLARVLVAFREQHGPFHQPDDLRQIRILEPAALEKLRPYLQF